jgi:hypothetical protein
MAKTKTAQAKLVSDFLEKDFETLLALFSLVHKRALSKKAGNNVSFAILNEPSQSLKMEIFNGLQITYAGDMNEIYTSLVNKMMATSKALISFNKERETLMKEEIRKNIEMIFKQGTKDLNFVSKLVKTYTPEEDKYVNDELDKLKSDIKKVILLKGKIDQFTNDNNLSQNSIDGKVKNVITIILNLAKLNISNDLLLSYIEHSLEYVSDTFGLYCGNLDVLTDENLEELNKVGVNLIRYMRTLMLELLSEKHLFSYWVVVKQHDNVLLDTYDIVKLQSKDDESISSKHTVSIVNSPDILLDVAEFKDFNSMIQSCKTEFRDFEITISSSYSPTKELSDLGDIYGVFDALYRFKKPNTYKNNN